MSKYENGGRIGRREVLLGGGAAALAGAVAVSPGESQAQSRKWSREADIVVVGGGAAGLTAAVTAVSEGAEVILLEKLPMIGGTTAKSGAVFWIPNNYSLREKNITDNKRDCLAYMCRYSYPERYDPNDDMFGLDEPAYRLLEALYDHGAPMVDLVRKQGAMRMHEWRMWDIDVSAPDYMSHMPENKVPKGRCLVTEAVDGSTGQGSDFAAQMEEWLEKKGVPILVGHEVTSIIKENDQVIGIEASTGGKPISIRARKGVIFGSGGYAHNTTLIRQNQPIFIYGSCAQSGATGDFVEMGVEAGAKLGNMENAWRTSVILDQALENRVLGWAPFMVPGDAMIMVNRFGQRVVNEKRNYNDRTKVQLHFDPNTADYPNRFLFVLYDRRVAELYAGQYPYPASKSEGHIIEAGSWDELGKKIDARLAEVEGKTGGVRLASDFGPSLKSTIDRFNGFAKQGRDADFERGVTDFDQIWERAFGIKNKDTEWSAADAKPNNTMHPFQDDGPYYAFIVAPGALDTNGGPVVNEHAQVLGRGDKPIPGLYGAGNCIASPSRHAYFGAGGTIGPAMTYGYIAARHALGKGAKST